jgi:hypothetical protein
MRHLEASIQTLQKPNFDLVAELIKRDITIPAHTLRIQRVNATDKSIAPLQIDYLFFLVARSAVSSHVPKPAPVPQFRKGPCKTGFDCLLQLNMICRKRAIDAVDIMHISCLKLGWGAIGTSPAWHTVLARLVNHHTLYHELAPLSVFSILAADDSAHPLLPRLRFLWIYLLETLPIDRPMLNSVVDLALTRKHIGITRERLNIDYLCLTEEESELASATRRAMVKLLNEIVSRFECKLFGLPVGKGLEDGGHQDQMDEGNGADAERDCE